MGQRFWALGVVSKSWKLRKLRTLSKELKTSICHPCSNALDIAVVLKTSFGIKFVTWFVSLFQVKGGLKIKGGYNRCYYPD